MTKTLTRRTALHLGAAAGAAAAFSPLAAPMAFGNTLEKTALKFGFIKLTDMAPIAIAKEKGFFAQYEITDVEIEAQANWKVLLDGVIDGVLDGAHARRATHWRKHWLWPTGGPDYAVFHGPERQWHHSLQ